MLSKTMLTLTAMVCMSNVTFQSRFTVDQSANQICEVNDAIFTYVTPSAVMCAATCHSDQLCVGFLYNESIHTCVGCGTVFTDISDILYSSVTTGSNYQMDTRYNPNCSDIYGWTMFDYTGYKLVLSYMVYEDAKKYCNDLCSDLVHTDTPLEIQVLKAIVITADIVGAYIGLEYIPSSYEWVWGHDGSHPNVTDWHYEEPNGIEEYCVAVLRDLGYTWADVSCSSTEYYFVCQKRFA